MHCLDDVDYCRVANPTLLENACSLQPFFAKVDLQRG